MIIILGPIGLPLLGHIPFMDIKNVGRSCKRLGRKYGDIFSLFLGTKPVVVLNSWPLIKEAFSKKEFSGRPGMFSGTFFQKGKTGNVSTWFQSKICRKSHNFILFYYLGISTTEGEPWESQRNFLHNYLMNLTKGKGSQGFHELIMDEVSDMKMELSKKVTLEQWIKDISYHQIEL